MLVIIAWNINSTKAEFYFKNINSDQGLSSNSVNAILRDKQGHLWVGTNLGLNRFDGYNTQVYKHDVSNPTSLNNNYVLSLKQDADDVLWIQTKTGLNTFDYQLEKVSSDCLPILSQRGITDNYLLNIVCGKNITAHFVNNLEVKIYNHKTKSIIKVQKDNREIFYENGCFDNDDNLWLIDRSCMLYKINTKNGKITNRLKNLTNSKNTYNRSLYVDKRNNLWVTLNSSLLYLFDTKTNKFTDFKNELRGAPFNSFPIRSVIEDENSTIWIATDHGGICLLNPFNFSYKSILEDEKNNFSLSENTITALFPDADGAIWVGTYKQGVDYYHPLNRRFSTNKIPGLSSNNDINCFVEDNEGNIFIGTNGKGLFKYNIKTNTYNYVNYNSNGNIDNTIVSLLFDTKGRLWIGTYMDGLYCYDGKKFIHYFNNVISNPVLPDNNIWSLVEDANQAIWIGTLNVGFYKFDETVNMFVSFNSERNRYSTIECSLKDNENNLLFGSAWGITVLKPNGKFHKYLEFNKNNDRFAERNYINSIAQDKKGYFWIATQNGLAVLNITTGNYHFLNTEPGLENKSINMVIVDKENAVWLSTTTGIYMIKIIDYGQLNDIKTNIIRFGKEDGLQDNKFNGKSAYQSKNGKLFFGGINGFNVINPDDIKPEKTLQNVVLTNLYINNNLIAIGDNISGRVLLKKSLSFTPSISLKHDESTITIAFTALDFLHPEKNNYEYQLKGFDDKWITIDASNPKATYNNLSRGTYTFNVRVKNNGTFTDSKPTSLIIEVEPPFWLSWPAFLLYFIIISVLIVFIYRYLIDRATFELRLSKEHQERQHIEEISAMKVKFFTNLSHELRTPVSLIMLPIENMLAKNIDAGIKNNLTMVLRNAKRLLFIVNQLLDFRKLEVGEITYHPVMGDIVSFIKDIVLPFMDISQNKNIKLTVKSNVEELYTNFDHNKLERILFNLLSNAFKFTPNHGSVEVNIQYTEGIDLPIRIEVTDTGIGIDKSKISNIFKPFYQVDNQGAIADMGTGIGLSITYEFVRLHNGNIHVESEIDKGTSFIIELPMTEERAPVIKEDLPEEELVVSLESMKIPTMDSISKKAKTILLVDDNDDFRFYLVENLRSLYNVIEANNGQIAYEKANRFLPDIIVSDVTMPEMDGFEFCRKVKTEVNTSHIPVVLLTANTLDDDKITGFEAGADEYISKPFNVGVLKARIRNLLLKKDEQRSKLNNQSGLSISEVNLPTLDEKLLEKVNKYTLEKIADSEFGIEDLSKLIGMSTVYLNKKMSALTGKTTSEYVRSIRLRKAANLLEKSDLTISEVAYEVGYNSPKYFSKYFKEEYGILPSEYRKNYM